MREWLAEARAKAGLTQKEVGKKLDVSESYYSLIEQGLRQKKMDIALVSKLSTIFDIPVTEIIKYETGDAGGEA